jgi:glycosyltransferase involved in cell wall biosynthesis
LLIYLNRDGSGKGGPEVWTTRFRNMLLPLGYGVTFDLNDPWQAALFNINNVGIEKALERDGIVAYRVANGYLPPWFVKMGLEMQPKHFSVNAEVAQAIENAEVVIYQSHWAKKQLDSYIQARSGDFEIIHNGVDLRRFSPGSASVSNIPVLGTVGLFRYKYRLETFFQLSRRLNFKHQLLIVGSVDSEAGKILAQYQTDPLIGPRILYQSYISPDKLVEYYRRMSLLVHPVSGDACPNVVVEALACGVPVVAPKFGGSAEIIGTGGRCFTAEPWVYDLKFVGAMEVAVREVLQEQKSFSEKARLQAEINLDITKMTRAYLAALRLKRLDNSFVQSEKSIYQRFRQKGAQIIVRPRFYTAIALRKASELRRKIVKSPQNKKTRIAFTLYDFHVGGIENWLYRLALSLKDEFDFYFLATTVSEFLPKFEEVGVCAYLPTPVKMRSYLQKTNIDVIQVHNQRWPIDAAIAAGVSKVIERTDGTRSCTRVAKTGLDLVIASARGTIPLIAEKISLDKIRLIYNGIDLNIVDSIQPIDFCGENRFVVGRASRFGRGKNLKLLIQAASELKASIPELLVAFVGGDSPMPGAEPIQSELEFLAKPLGNTVEFLGIVENSIPMVKRFDIGTCVSNPNNEGIPNSLIEAMACGRPVISTDVDQVSELVLNGKNGFLIPPGDAGALAHAIRQLESNQDLRDRMGKAARRTIENQFSSERAAKEYSAVYRELLGQ